MTPCDEGGDGSRLLDLARSGDERALNGLLAILHPHAVRAAERWLRSTELGPAEVHDTAQDVAQAALTRVMVHLMGCRAADLPRLIAWQTAIVRRLLLDLGRADERRDALFVPMERVTETDLAIVSAPGWESDPIPPGSEVMRRVLADCWRMLPHESALVLWCHAVLRQPWAIVAQELGTSPAAAKRRYQRACCALRRAMLRHVHQLSGDQRAVATHTLERWTTTVAHPRDDATWISEATQCAHQTTDRTRCATPSSRASHRCR